MNKILISVVIPLYNKEKTIKKTLNSILSQSYSNYEIVIVDDGSTDDSYSIVSNYIKSDIEKLRIRLLQQENGGPSKARNTGAKHAQGEWIVFLDADDELLPDALNTFVSIIRKHPDYDIIDCNKYICYGNRRTLAVHPLEGKVKNALRECYFGRVMPGNGSSAFRREFMLKHLYDERIRRFEDAELLIRQLVVARVYSSKTPTLLFNRDFAEASKPRKNVKEDYFAYLDFKKGGFWRKMCVYRFFLGERGYYPEYSKEKYGKMYRRYDWLLIYKLLNWYSKFFKR